MLLVMDMHGVEVLHSFLIIKRLILEINFELIVLNVIVITYSHFRARYAFRLWNGDFYFLASLN